MPAMDDSTPSDDFSGRRLLDAVGNRLEEALRTVEDQLRFRHALAALPAEWRRLRHEAAALRRTALGGVPAALARDVAGDPGRPESAPAAAPHSGGGAVLSANIARAREAARSLEEELRRGSGSLARDAERLRYRIYSLEGATLGFLHRRERLAGARLYVLVTTSLASGPPEEVARAAVRGGAQVIQLREKSLEGRELLGIAERLREITAREGALLIINDRVEIAALCGADGVHLGQGDIRPAQARRFLGPEAIIGLSTHAGAEAARAMEEGADYIGVGPLHETRTKEHRRAVGLPYIAEARAATDLPGFAIGGVNRETIPAVLAAGARRVAICTAVIADPDPEGAARHFRALLDRSWGEDSQS